MRRNVHKITVMPISSLLYSTKKHLQGRDPMLSEHRSSTSHSHVRCEDHITVGTGNTTNVWPCGGSATADRPDCL